MHSSAIPALLHRHAQLFWGAAMTVLICGCNGAPSTSVTLANSSSSKASIPSQPALPKPQRSSTPPSAPIATKVPRADDWFEDVTATSGIDFSYRNGQEGGQYYILETIGGGAALVDYDRDQDLDVFITGGGTISGSPPAVQGLPSALFRNDGQLKFSAVTSTAGLASTGDYSHGAIATDFDCDGFTDILVTAYGQCRLFHNQGDGTFIDVSPISNITSADWWTAAAWGDIDRDGLPDLFLASYLTWSPETDRPCKNKHQHREICGPNLYPQADDRVFRNRGDGTFQDISTEVGLVRGGSGLGVVAADLNADGLVDFYVANDAVDNFLYLGRPGGTLEEVGHLAGVAVDKYGKPEGSMGVEAGDYDGDGKPDLFVTNFEREDNALYHNSGNGLFTYASNAAGLAGPSRRQVGFGTAMEDFDGDGWPDLLVINGHAFYGGGELPYQQRSQMFRNGTHGRFEEVSSIAGSFFQTEHAGRGAAVGDLDNDGGLDLVIVHQNEPVTILRNRKPCARYIRLNIVGTKADPDAIGTMISITSMGIDAHKLTRFVRSGAGYLSQFDNRILIPIPSESVEVEVRWPGGTTEVFYDVPEGKTHCLIQGQGTARHDIP